MSNTKTFDDLQFEQDINYPHEKLGKQPKFNAEISANDYVVSVVYGGSTYSHEGTYEVAVFDSYDDPVKLSDHDTVLGWRTKQEVTRIMKVVQLRPDLLKPRTIEQIWDEAGV